MSTVTSAPVDQPPQDSKPAGTVINESDIPDSNKPIICIDLDDVLSQTNGVVADWHNAAYGTNMTLDDFYYYYYWRNPYWGTPNETFRKVEEFYKTPRLYEAPPIEGALEGLKALKEMGFRLVLVTARQIRELPQTEEWMDKHYSGIFEQIICTGMSQETLADDKAMLTKLSKADVCKKLGAKLMIDDSIENALKCARAEPPIPILLFGDYQWNKREVNYAHIDEEMSYDERCKKEGGNGFLERDITPLPDNLVRVNDWKETVNWVEENIKP
ncbi:hypothetical protein WOLCODRAFT_135069 [Wolfiporia cocos MD-104 SS10]|uniref:HAD-like protein n=1 Tax=Wolfiporia cocos (strain MD-104) TaxID=742152 RepID=A0A2H3IUF0_WOLCO|nr:hypothetical protein WOLCODRAFT_135069 [Wolfiporia cocos MD-104 SS10]